MLFQVGKISLCVLASVNWCKASKLWVHVTTLWEQEATVPLVPAQSQAKSWELLLSAQPSPLWVWKISFLWWSYSSNEDLDTSNRKLFLPETGPHSYSFYMYLSLFTKGQLNSHKSAKFITFCLPKYFLSFQLNVAFSGSFYLATA